ncbi:MAG: DUF4145 domain-containing protein, partial [Pseudanabaena sp.]
MEIQSANFSFLSEHDPQLVNLAARAEHYFHSDSNTCILKLRQFAERLAQHVADETGHYQSQDEKQVDLLRRLETEGIISSEVAKLFHNICKGGNNAAHTVKDDRREALTLLENAHELGIWFHRKFGNDSNFRAGAFVPPVAPIDAAAEWIAEIERLKAIANDSQSAAERSRREAEEKEIALKIAEEKASQAEAAKQQLEKIASEKEKQRIAENITNQIGTPPQTANIPNQLPIDTKNINPDENLAGQVSNPSREIAPIAKEETALTPGPSPKRGEGGKKKGWHHGV